MQNKPLEQLGGDGKFSNYVVDPNHPDLNTVVAEDMFIYMDLKVIPRSRSVISFGDDGNTIRKNNTKILSFVATQDDKNGDFITTDYLNTGGHGEGSSESLGITGIKITQTANFSTKVNINFKDVRGGGIFNNYESVSRTNIGGQNMSHFDNTSDYGFFFKLPYPLFELTVKGVYGKAVTYCLHLINWTGDFNAEDGSFNISADFYGFQFAFFNDINMSYIAACGDTHYGKSILESRGLISYNDLIAKLGNLDHLAEEFKKNSDEFKQLQLLNTSYVKLGELQKLWAKPYSVSFLTLDNGLNVDKRYFALKDQLILRDVLITPNSENFDKLFSEYIKLYNEYNNFVNKNDISDLRLNLNNINISKKLNVRQINVISTVNKMLRDNGLDSLTASIDINDKFTGSEDTLFNVYDLYNIRTKIHEQVIKLKNEKDILESKINDSINDEFEKKLGFELNIRGLFEIILGNVDVFLETINYVATKAENFSTQRYNIIPHKITDVASNTNNLFPFPAVYDEVVGTEVYLGEKVNQEEYFPEIRFIEEMLDAFVSHSDKRVKADLTEIYKTPVDKSKNWFSINQLDTVNRPYQSIELQGFPNGNIPQQLLQQLLNRYMVSLNYSNYPENFILNKFSKYESDTLNNSIIDDVYRTELKKVLKNSSDGTITGLLTLYNYLDNGQLTIGNLEINGIELTNNLQTIFSSLDVQGKSILDSSFVNYDIPVIDGKYHEIIDDNVNTKDLSLFVWSDEIQTEIKKWYTLKTGEVYNEYNNVQQSILSYVDNISFVEGKLVDGDFSVDNNLKEFTNSLTLVGNDVYIDSYTILFTLFRNFDLDSLADILNKRSMNVKLPKLFLCWLGAELKSNIDYLDNINQINKEYLIQIYDNWVLGDFNDIYEDFIYYSNSTSDIPRITKLLSDLHFEFTSVVTLISTSPSQWLAGDYSLVTDVDRFLTYFNNFKNNFNRLVVNTNKKGDIKKNRSVVKDNDLRLATYKNIKNIYDKWIAGTTHNGRPYNFCSLYKNNNRKLIDYFYFVDTKMNYIGEDLVINPNIILSTTKTKNLSLTGFIGHICSSSDMIFQTMPTFVNIHKAQDVKDMFKSYLTIDDAIQNAAFFMIYTNSNSKLADIQNNSYYYNNDGYDLRESSLQNLPKTYTERKADPNKTLEQNVPHYTLPSFRVAYGDQNQSHFQDINVGFENKAETYESLYAEAELVDRKGAAQRYWKGAGVYNMYSVRSYQCEVSTIGNMMIQPMQHFQLDNVPFFHGAYFIESVTHDIKPNSITTSFKGRRQSKYSVPIVNSISSYIDIFLEDVEDTSDKKLEKDLSSNGVSTNDNNVVSTEARGSDGLDESGDSTSSEVGDADLTLIAFNKQGQYIEYNYNI